MENSLDEKLKEIFLALKDLDDRLLKLEAEKSDAGVITEGAPKFVRDFVSRIKEGVK